MDPQVTRQLVCTQRVALNGGARLEDLKWKRCGKPATTFVIITLFGNHVKLQMCEEHKKLIVDLSKMQDKEILYREAGVPEHVIHNTISKEISEIVSRN